MADNYQTLYVHGPMHPDFFNGETPIMVPVVDLKVFRVNLLLRVCRYKREEIDVLARNNHEAEHIAESIIEHTSFDDVEGCEVDSCKEVADIEADQEMIDNFLQFRTQK